MSSFFASSRQSQASRYLELNNQSAFRSIAALTCAIATRAQLHKGADGKVAKGLWSFTCYYLGKEITCFTRNEVAAKMVNRLAGEQRPKITLSGEATSNGANWLAQPIMVDTLCGLRNQ